MENKIRFELVKPVYYRRRQCHICDGYTDKNDFLCESKEGPFWYTRICKTCLEAGEFDERLKENIQQFREYADALETMVGRIDAPTYKEWQAAEFREYNFSQTGVEQGE